MRSDVEELIKNSLAIFYRHFAQGARTVSKRRGKRNNTQSPIANGPTPAASPTSSPHDEGVGRWSRSDKIAAFALVVAAIPCADFLFSWRAAVLQERQFAPDLRLSYCGVPHRRSELEGRPAATLELPLRFGIALSNGGALCEVNSVKLWLGRYGENPDGKGTWQKENEAQSELPYPVTVETFKTVTFEMADMLEAGVTILGGSVDEMGRPSGPYYAKHGVRAVVTVRSRAGQVSRFEGAVTPTGEIEGNRVLAEGLKSFFAGEMITVGKSDYPFPARAAPSSVPSSKGSP